MEEKKEEQKEQKDEQTEEIPEITALRENIFTVLIEFLVDTENFDQLFGGILSMVEFSLKFGAEHFFIALEPFILQNKILKMPC